MKMRLLIALVVLASAAFALPVVYVDPFSTTMQRVCVDETDPYCATSSPSAIAASETIGGWRYMAISRNGADGIVTGRVIPSVSFLSFAQDVASSGVLETWWAGAGEADMNLDITEAPTGEELKKFELRVRSDLGVIASLMLVTNGVAGTPVMFTIPATSVWTIVEIPYSAFVGQDLTDVDRIVLVLDGTNHPESDVAIDYLGLATPEPGSLLMIGGGLLGLCLLRRRLRRA